MGEAWRPAVEAIFRDWDAGEIARYEIGERLMAVLDAANVDALTRELPDWYRSDFAERLHELALVEDPGQLVSIFGGNRRETDAQRAARESAERRETERVLPIARAWAARHPRGLT